MTPSKTIRRVLLDAGVLLARADQDRAHAMALLRTAAREAIGSKMTITEVSRLAGVTRPTVYALLAKK